MSDLTRFLSRIRTAQWILIAAGLLAGAASLLVGVSDNPPGILLLYAGLTCLAGAWVWNWRSPREFWKLLLISLAGFSCWRGSS